MSARRSLADRPPRRLLSTRPRLSADDPVPGPALPRAPVPQRLPAIPPAAPGAEPARCPDLLNLVPAHTVEHGKLVRALTFSFVAGNDSGAVAHAFDTAPIAASTFEPECFFDELYVEDLLRGCMSPPRPPKAGPLHERYLMRLLSQPPADAAVRALRTEVWRELAEGQPVRTAVDALFSRLSELFSLFSGDDQVSLRGEQTRRRIEILRVVADVLRAMQAPSLAAATSCLHRTAHYAAQVCATPAYQHLEELLRYENERAYADLTLQLGSDGRVRGLRVVGVREDTRNRYHVSLAQQWLGRIGLWFRGFRVDDGEIIDRWLDQVFDEIVEHLPPLVQLYGDLEWYLAGQAFRDACLARGLPVCLPEWTPAEAHAPCRVASLYNPLLFALGVVPVSCDVEVSPWGETTLITGPNSGGKTRLLQAVGLLQLCAQAGMWVPAASARLRPVPGLFASLSQPAGAEQSEGRLGTELKRIRMLFERADPGTLVLVDELCSGTSPSEGEELFRLVLELMRELSPVALISTHFLRFAADLAATPEVDLPLHFIRVELDDRMRPTYRFGAGVADTSLAQQTAARLGVTREELRAVLAGKRP
jgi:DNA mismatch repair protein MutS2